MRVMLVEPSRVGLKLMSRMLEEMGHDVSPFSEGDAALAYLHTSTDIEVLITSFEIPGVSGIQLCWEARVIANAGRPLYVIAMSSSNDAAHLVEALDGGADDFINKPPNRIELEARLRAAERLNQARRELVRLATCDPLTALLNRRAWFTLATDVIATPTPHAVILFDIDHFKGVNDTYGHDGGDQVLRSVAHTLAPRHLPAARVGGEEFAVLCAGRTEAAAFAEAERLRAAIAATAIRLPGGEDISVTISLGVAQRQPDQNVDAWMKAADVALYAAKAAGRDRTVRASETAKSGGSGAGLARTGATPLRTPPTGALAAALSLR